MKKNSDINDLQNKIDAFKKKEKANESSALGFHLSSSNTTRGFQLVIDFVSGVFIGFSIGYFLDMLFQTNPWCLVIFTLFGGAAGVLNIYRAAQAKDKEL